MSKRKQSSKPKDEEENAGMLQNSDEDEDLEMINVDFEMFDPQPQDFHGLRVLLRQLFDADSELFNLSELADVILSQPLLGSTVKTDGHESDPYAFLTIINMNEHKDKPVIKELATYLLEKSKPNSVLHNHLAAMLPLSEASPSAHLGLILTERLINMPTEVIPPLYKMLLEEISWALEENEPYSFSSYLILSKTYTEIPSKLDIDNDAAQPTRQPLRKKKKGVAAGTGKNGNLKENFYFHPEDEVLHQHATAHMNFKYTKELNENQADAKRTFSDFGIIPQGHMILIEKDQLPGAVESINNTFKP